MEPHEHLKYITRFSFIALAIALPGWCGSTINSYSGNIGFIGAPPGSLVPGAVEDDLKALLFMEDTDLSFASTITVDATKAGLYNSKASLTPGAIPAGTVVSSTYLHADPVIQGTAFNGSVTFNSNILGVIATGASLFETDPLLGDDNINYGSANSPRGFELSSPQDQFTISADLRTLTFSLKTWGFTDNLRILTEGALLPSTAGASPLNAAPEPGTLILIALGLGFVTIGIRRRSKSPSRSGSAGK